MDPTVAAIIITLLSLLGLVCSHVVERNDDLIRRLPRVVLNLVIIGRYFGWMGLIASIGYFALLLTTPPQPDATPLLFFDFVYFFALLMMVVSVIIVPVLRRCPYCGKWDEFHQVGVRDVSRSKGQRKVMVTRRNPQGETIDQHEEMLEMTGHYPAIQYQCRHCGHQWEVIGKDEMRSWGD